MSREKVKELMDIRKAPSHDPNCATCERKPDRLYMDDIWNRAKQRAQKLGSASVRIIKKAR